ncbi:hypothetical protein CYLTODRAFT_382734 [Cylindrobasidium torrendii FP15055 ss-10]|uniref:Uncharacterized protein n=1 Tax=Cylindrobasidium torrendii FP15055 ss-10 TaxID=1314674 RepID=A0A0D7AYY3_9AGAR|nr:hypothetical protein CYLTODRAFT_382734 [Cylindrobasidium torrendii FP15055 ss-10]
MDRQAYLFVTSPFLPPSLLGTIRLAFSLYTLVTLVLYLVFGAKGQSEDASSFFAIFTLLSYIGTFAYFAVAAGHTILYSRGKFPFESWPAIIRWMHIWLFSTVSCFPLVITLIYYPIFGYNPPSNIDSWLWISMHGVNALFSIFEIVMTNCPPGPWRILIGDIALIAGYVGIAYVTRDTKGFNSTFLGMYIAILFAAEVVMFCVVQGLLFLRRYLVERAGWTNRFAGKVGGWHRVTDMTNDFVDLDGRSSMDVRGSYYPSSQRGSYYPSSTKGGARDSYYPNSPLRGSFVPTSPARTSYDPNGATDMRHSAYPSPTADVLPAYTTKAA